VVGRNALRNSGVSGYNTSKDDLTYSPLLQQVFFIGDGQTIGTIPQTFIAPAGATRLFVGTMDSYQWNNNLGSLAVTVVATNSPSATLSIACDAQSSSVTVSWPASANAWGLESTNALPYVPVASWPAVSERYETNASTVSVTFTNVPAYGTRFFRLRKL
jgi:hypothetical protein